MVDGKTRFSSIDSAGSPSCSRWSRSAIGAMRQSCQAAGALIARQDYRESWAGTGCWRGLLRRRRDRQENLSIPFSYNDRTVRRASRFSRLEWVRSQLGWTTPPTSGANARVSRRQRLAIQLFVEMTGALFFDEARLAPESLGKSIRTISKRASRWRSAWVIASTAMPRPRRQEPHAEFGLDRPDAVSRTRPPS